MHGSLTVNESDETEVPEVDRDRERSNDATHLLAKMLTPLVTPEENYQHNGATNKQADSEMKSKENFEVFVFVNTLTNVPQKYIINYVSPNIL